jgi:Zn-dependent M28 family amino/carboxypeptidase
VRRLWSAALFLLAPATSVAGQSPIDSSEIRADTYFLAHDALRGRGTGTPGGTIAAVYIASRCRRLGLEPVGSDYLLPVPLEAATVLTATQLTIAGPVGHRTFEAPEDFTPNVGTAETLHDFAGRLVFVGREEQVAAGAIGAIDLHGAIAATLGPFRGPAADTLVARGAVGMINLIPDAEGYALYRRSRGPERMYHRDADVRSSFLPPMPSVLAGPSIAAVFASALSGSGEPPRPQALDLSTVVSLRLARRPVDASNVACVFPGADPAQRDTAIAVTAHYDHLGVSTPDATGDSVYNGFSDNAAGVAMLLSIADALDRSETPPSHSVLFLFFTGEERGLLGSDYYVAHPAWPLGRTRAVVNLDAGAPPARPASWRLAGGDSTALGSLAVGVATARGWKATTSPPSANSDYFPFHREGVPAVFIIPGPGPYEGLSADSTRALRSHWDHYHQAGDEWFPDFPFSGLVRYADYALQIVKGIDQAEGPLRDTGR